MITGDHGKEIVVTDEGKFDPDSIPRKRWQDFHAELQDEYAMRGTAMDDARSEASGFSYATKQYPTASVHDFLDPGIPSRPASHVMHHGMGYQNNQSHLSLPMSESGQRGSGMHNMALAETEMLHLSLPTDDQLLAEIRGILETADLMTVTKLSVKNELERRFGVDLTLKKDYINSAIEAVLRQQL